MNTEHKQLIDGAAKLLGIEEIKFTDNDVPYHFVEVSPVNGYKQIFNPFDPERGHLMKVADAAKLSLRFGKSEVTVAEEDGGYSIFTFTKGDYESLALAVLRAASAVLKARGE